MALLNNPGLQAALNTLGVAESDWASAQRLPNPVITVGRFTRGGEEEWDRALHVNLARLLTMSMRADIEQRLFEQTRRNLTLEVLRLASDTKKAWVNAVAAAERAQVQRQALEAAEAGAELARRMAEAGNWSKLRQAREQVFYADAALAVARAEQLRLQTREQLVRLLGVEDPARVQLPERLPELPASLAPLRDVEQTFFMRFLRGSGPKGLSGIPPTRFKIIRPLIEVERAEIEVYLSLEKADSVTDSSNLKDDYLRNRIRFSLMREMKAINPHLSQAVGRTMDILREEERYFDILVTKTLMRLISRKSGSRIELFLIPLETLETVILRRVLRRALDETGGLRGVEFAHIEDIINLIKHGRHGDRINRPRGIRVVKGYATLVITAEESGMVGPYSLPVPGEVAMPEIKAMPSTTSPRSFPRRRSSSCTG